MKEKTVYVAKDGAEFDKENDCIEHEGIISKLDRLFKKLPPLPKDDNCKFAHGHGYIQHDPATFLAVQSEFVRLACEHTEGLKKYPYGTYGFWRYLDNNYSPFYHPYGGRLLNTDTQTFREYGQMYYKDHPAECDGGRINKVMKQHDVERRKFNLNT